MQIYKNKSKYSRAVFALVLVFFVINLTLLINRFVIFDKINNLALVLPNILLEETNTERLNSGIKPVVLNPVLVEAARLKAEDMANRGYFSHNTPEGKTPWYWLDKVGYNYLYAGENLAVNFQDSNEVTNAWMNSPSHRENIIKENYTEIGIATAKGVYKGKESVYVVQFFGTPEPAKIKISDLIPKTKKSDSVPKNNEVKTTKINNSKNAAIKTPAVLGTDAEKTKNAEAKQKDSYLVLAIFFSGMILASWLL